MPLRVSNVDLSPRSLLHNAVIPAGPIPPPRNVEGGVERPREASMNLLWNTFIQLSASKQDGVGGRIDLLG